MVQPASNPNPAPGHDDIRLARRSLERLAGRAASDQPLTFEADGEHITLPAAAVRLLLQALGEIASGNAAAVLPINAELTTQQAADLLGVSRPFVIKEMEEGRLPFRKVGAHRRVLLRDVLDYKARAEADRLAVLKKLTEQAQELDMGY